jgi:hypothetical protein
MLEELEDGRGLADQLCGEIIAKRKWPVVDGEYWSG